MSRPEKPIDWELVDELLEAGSDGVEIASYFHMHPRTFYDRVMAKYNITFTAYQSEKKSHGNSKLRKVQYRKALEGDNQCLTILGKYRLKQNDEEHEYQPRTSNVEFRPNFQTSNSQQIPSKDISAEDSQSS